MFSAKIEMLKIILRNGEKIISNISVADNRAIPK
jgi:hypothetical protein